VVQAEECFGDGADHPLFLFPEEERAVARAVDRRRREYATVRGCARACLERLGHLPVAIPSGIGRAPVWPSGVIGSMTHCPGYAAAAVGPAQRISVIGIDAEPDEPLPDGVSDLVSTPAERARLPQERPSAGAPCWDRLMFSAKESVYKAWFPRVGQWLDARDVEVVFDPCADTFTAELAHDGLMVDGCRVTRLHGRWTRTKGILVTAVVMVRG
jgi:4'-phosphopantetheinyl transferase EntD